MTYVLSEGFKGKKAFQVARILEILQSNPGVPYKFDDLCTEVGQKYPQDLQAAAIALHLAHDLDVYRQSGGGKDIYLVWPEHIEGADDEDVAGYKWARTHDVEYDGIEEAGEAEEVID